MSTKPTATASPRWLARIAGRVRKFSATLSDQAVVDGGVGLFIVIALSMLLLRNYQRPQIETLAPGAIASADVIAPEFINPIEDTDETERLREQAEASILPVFDFNPKAARDVRNGIEQMFATGRERMRDTSPDELRQAIKDASGIILDLDQVGVLIKHRFNPEIELLLVDHIESLMMTGVIDRRTHLVKLGPTGLARRDMKTGHEVTVTDLTPIRDLIGAHAALRSDKLVLPVEYDSTERRLLGEVLSSLVIPNLSYNDKETEGRRKVARQAVKPVLVSVERGAPIVVKGETVTRVQAELMRVASTYRPIGQRALEFAGTVVIVTLLLVVLWQYLMRYQRRHLRVRRHFLLQTASFVITLGLSRLFFSMAFSISQGAAAPFNSEMGYKYLAPLAVGAAFVTILTDAHAAFVFSAILAVFVGVLSGNVHLAAYTLVSSVGAIYHLQNCRDRTALVRAGLWIGLVNAAAALALDLLGANERMLAEGGLEAIGIVLFDAFCGFASGVLAAMVTSILLPLFEWLFEITTNIKLLELSNLNLPLLKQLAERAPGTYHHSIMVGLLAEAAAEAIGGDALFTRVACYYHDIGKTMRPAYFIENQTYMDNRHDNLAPKMSSIILANHVKQGIELARQYKLPPRIIAIIPQHHGTGLMKYFYYKARQTAQDPGSVALEQEFRYPGPKPQTREAGIIMIADSVEAAARTVQEPTPAKLRNMIEMIIERIRNDGQLDECDITLRELKIVEDSFVKVLMGIHHHRIAYPGYDFNQAGSPALLARVKPDVEGRGLTGKEVTGEIPVARDVREARGD